MRQETAAIHVGYDTNEGFGTMAVPIFQSTAYDFGSAETAAARFDLKDSGYIYTRLSNPTTDIFEKRVAALEGGAAAIATASGQSALFYSIINLAQAGDNIIIAKKIYGGTTVLFTHTLKRFGIEARVFDSDTADDLESLIDEKTRAIFFETLSNPQISIPNIEKIVEIANKYGIISITDNTVPTPYYQEGKLWFTADKNGRQRYAIYALSDGKEMPSTLSWHTNVPKSVMLLVVNKRLKMTKNNDGKVTIKLPEGMKAEPFALQLNL